MVLEWPGRSRNILNKAKNILNKAKNRKNLYFWDLTRLKMKKTYFLGPKIFSRPTQIEKLEFSKNVFSGLYDACTALIRRFVDFGPIFVNFWDLCWGSFETTRRAETDMVVWYYTGESPALNTHTYRSNRARIRELEQFLGFWPRFGVVQKVGHRSNEMFWDHMNPRAIHRRQPCPKCAHFQVK